MEEILEFISDLIKIEPIFLSVVLVLFGILSIRGGIKIQERDKVVGFFIRGWDIPFGKYHETEGEEAQKIGKSKVRWGIFCICSGLALWIMWYLFLY
jgi:hypothetical protein